MHRTRAAVGDAHGKMRGAIPELAINEAIVSLRAAAIGNDPAIIHLSDDFLDHWMVDAHDGKAIERNVLDKAHEGFLGLVKGAVVIEMFRIDIGDDDHISWQL